MLFTKNRCKVEKKWCKYLKHGICSFDENTPLAKIKRCPKREKSRTIRFIDLLKKTDFSEVFYLLQLWHPSIKSWHRDHWYQIFFCLYNARDIEKTDWFIRIDLVWEEESLRSCGGDPFWYDAVCVHPGWKGHSFDFGTTRWHELLGMNICKTSLSEFSDCQIVAAILWDMTWDGFDKEDGEKQNAIPVWED